MKKIVVLILTVIILSLTVSCSQEASKPKNPAPAKKAISAETKKKLDEVLNSRGFKGDVSLTKKGDTFYTYVNGEDSDGKPLKTSSPMYLGSVSKQFCTASIIILRDKGRLSLNDKLKKFFPEYKIGKNITIKNLLTMRSGIMDMVNEGQCEGVDYNNSEKKNIKAVKKWIFSQKLKFKPDSEYSYSNSNYFLLADIVSQVSGQRYHDFVRENIFKPLKMDSSGFVEEVKDNPPWAKGLTRGEENGNIVQTGLSNGAGDITSNCTDMEKWMEGLSGGKIISKKSYREMIKDYSPESATRYGYGLERLYKDGVGHFGVIESCCALDYINEKNDLCLFAASNRRSTQSYISSLPMLLLKNLINPYAYGRDCSEAASRVLHLSQQG